MTCEGQAGTHGVQAIGENKPTAAQAVAVAVQQTLLLGRRCRALRRRSAVHVQ